MKFIFFLFLALPHLAWPDCSYSVDQKKTKISWTAFKTPKKVGVTGSFPLFKLNTKASKDELSLIRNASFVVDAKKIDTGNPGRDRTIRRYFFTSNEKPIEIKGKVMEVNGEKTTVLLSIHGKSKEIVFKNIINENKITLSGKIDIFDFNLDPQFAALHKQCKVYHEGKTWPDVNIMIEATFIKKCLNEKF